MACYICVKYAHKRTLFATLYHSKSELCTHLPLTAPQKASAMGIHLPSNIVDDPLTNPPLSVTVTFTGISICPDAMCLTLPPLPDPFHVFCPLPFPTSQLYQGTSGGWDVIYGGAVDPDARTELILLPVILPSSRITFAFSGPPSSSWLLALDNQQITCSGFRCGTGGHASVSLLASASAVAASVGVPPSNDRMYEPFITQSGAAVYRYASRSKSTNVIVQTEE